MKNSEYFDLGKFMIEQVDKNSRNTIYKGQISDLYIVS